MDLQIQFIERLVKLGYCYQNNGNVYIHFNKVDYPKNMWIESDKSFSKSVAVWASIRWKCMLDADFKNHRSSSNSDLIWKFSNDGYNSPWGKGFPVNLPYDVKNILYLT